MEKNIYLNKGIVQKIISKESYDIMKICKSNGNYNDTIEEIQKYILDSYCNTTYLSDSELYNYLLKIAFDLLDEDGVKNILIHGINDCFKKKMFENGFNYTPINYVDLLYMLITNISLIKIRTEVEGEYIDLFLIDDENQILSREEYIMRLDNKEIN